MNDDLRQTRILKARAIINSSAFLNASRDQKKIILNTLLARGMNAGDLKIVIDEHHSNNKNKNKNNNNITSRNIRTSSSPSSSSDNIPLALAILLPEKNCTST